MISKTIPAATRIFSPVPALLPSFPSIIILPEVAGISTLSDVTSYQRAEQGNREWHPGTRQDSRRHQGSRYPGTRGRIFHKASEITAHCTGTLDSPFEKRGHVPCHPVSTELTIFGAFVPILLPRVDNCDA
jgi:hypothetical protein